MVGETPSSADSTLFAELVMSDFVEAGRATRFQRGQSGNPAGSKPDPEDLDELLIHILGKKGARQLVEAMIAPATHDDGHIGQRAAEYIFDRIKGKPRQTDIVVSTAEPAFVTVLRKLIDDRSALEGHSRPAGALQPAQPRSLAEVGESPRD